MRIFAYIIEFLVLAFIVTAFIFISKQSKVTDAQQEQSADSSSVEMLDNLNDTSYMHKFDADTLAADSSAKR